MNTAQPEIRIFTRKQLSAWLYDNQAIEGLSGAVITPTRADAIVHNPWIEDDSPVVAAVYLGNKLAAFTASFPDRIAGKTFHWFSTLWCSPEHRGKGFGLLVVGNLCEIFGPDTCVDMWGAPETVGIFRYLGHQTANFPEYRFEPKHINRSTLKGKIAYIANRLTHITAQRKSLEITIKDPYTLKYINYIDDNTYRFITQHATGDLMLRSKETLNWILSCHFMHRGPLIDSEPKTNPFDDRDSRYWMSGIEVIADNQTVGFYILRDADSELSLKYLYFIPEYRDCVFHSIARHIVALGNPSFSTRNPQLAEYISTFKWFDREVVTDISFSYPERFPIPPSAVSQGGDGDGFV